MEKIIQKAKPEIKISIPSYWCFGAKDFKQLFHLKENGSMRYACRIEGLEKAEDTYLESFTNLYQDNPENCFEISKEEFEHYFISALQKLCPPSHIIIPSKDNVVTVESLSIDEPIAEYKTRHMEFNRNIEQENERPSDNDGNELTHELNNK